MKVELTSSEFAELMKMLSLAIPLHHGLGRSLSPFYWSSPGPPHMRSFDG